MRAVNRIALVAGLAGLAVACGPERHGYSDLRPLTIGVRFGLENLCTGSQSPPIRVVNAPESTASYRIRVSNVSVMLQSPREWTIPAPRDPELVPFGALDGWTGPCPGDFQRFRYRVEALALDAAGTPIAYGLAENPVEPVNQQAQENWRRGGAGPNSDPTLPPTTTPDVIAPRDVFPRERDNVFFEDRGTGGQPGIDPLAPGYLQPR